MRRPVPPITPVSLRRLLVRCDPSVHREYRCMQRLKHECEPHSSQTANGAFVRRGFNYLAIVLLLVLLVDCGGSNNVSGGGGGGGDPTIVTTQSGKVRGVIDGQLIAFRGIPYAAPPVGDLRWHPPAPPASWSVTRDASTFGNICIQIQSNGQILGAEDCLTLNVFKSASSQAKNQAVMVFFHGGGHIFGSSQQPPFDAPPLATHGVILVTVEFRLGVLGFFAHPLLTAEGGGSSDNYGLMDELAALTWVQGNIAAFGGDPSRVMVFGQSSGGYDVQALLVSPAARGLFSRAAIESDSIIPNETPSLASVETQDAPFVQLVGCQGAADILGCLRSVPATLLLENQENISLLAPIEPRVVPMDPFTVLNQQGSPVPILWGSNREEATFLGVDPTTPITASQYAAAVHQEFDPFGAGVADNVLLLYPVADYDAPIWALVDVDSDFDVTCGVRIAALAALGTGRPPVWRYLFTHRFENDSSLADFRAFHTAELYFVFGNLQNINGTPYTPTEAEVNLSNLLMNYWTNFAANGDPNGSGLVQWPAYDSTAETIQELDDTISTLNGYHIAQCNYLTTFDEQP
jgi:para-nitrobenzyl esterase